MMVWSGNRRKPEHYRPVIGSDDGEFLSLTGKYSDGKIGVVDRDVYFWAKHFSWYVAPNGYITARAGGRNVTIHRIIMGDPVGLHVDHISGNRMDNRRANLRAVTRSQNLRNVGPRRNQKDGLKGISQHKYKTPEGNARWCARISPGRRWIHLGFFDNPRDAAIAYDHAAKIFYGEFAYLNFPEVTLMPEVAAQIEERIATARKRWGDI